MGSKAGFGGIGGVGARQGTVVVDGMDYNDGRKGGFDPHARIPDMDLDGIDAAFLYPSLGLFAGSIHDPAFAAAMCRAYNRWLADYCKPYPDRLFGIAMLPMQSVEAAIGEMRFARKELGFRGGFLRPNPYDDRKLHDPDYEPFWREAEELDFCDRPARGRQQRHADGRRRPLRRPRRAAHHLAHHGDDAGRHEHDLGRRVRAPSRSCASASSNRAAAGSRRGSTAWTGISTTRASTIPASRCGRAICSGATAGSRSSRSRASIGALADYIGPHKILWATDYPHRDGFFPGAPAMLKERMKGLSAEAQRTDHGGRRHGVLRPQLRIRCRDARIIAAALSASKPASTPPRMRGSPSTRTVSISRGLVCSRTWAQASPSIEVAERTFADQHDVGALARRQRADAVVEAEHARRPDGRDLEQPPRLQERQARPHGRPPADHGREAALHRAVEIALDVEHHAQLAERIGRDRTGNVAAEHHLDAAIDGAAHDVGRSALACRRSA